jgi:hypothetical protein
VRIDWTFYKNNNYVYNNNPYKSNEQKINQSSNENNTPKDKAKEKNQKTTLNIKIPDSQSLTIEASDLSSMLRRREK